MRLQQVLLLHRVVHVPHGLVRFVDAQELPSLTVDESHETMRDMHDPMQQQHLL